MRILILNALYPTPLHPKVVGGAEKSVRNLAEALVREGHEVEVIRSAPPRSGVTREEVNGVIVYAAASRNVYWPFGSEVRPTWKRVLWHLIDDWGPPPALVRERLKVFQPNVMHTNTLTGLTTNVWALARRRGVRIVHTLRDYYLLCPRSKYYKNGRNCDRPCGDCKALTVHRRSNSSLPDAVVGNSMATLNLHLKEGLFPGVPVRTAVGSLEEAGAQPLPQRSREADPRTIFGYIGRVTEEKGIERLAEAYGLMPEQSAGLVIAGESDPDIQARLRALAGGREIQFMGFVAPRAFYEAVDVVVAPSLWHEPLPRSVIDAISYGRPVIGSNRGGTPEAMGQPPFGWIFDPDEEGSMRRVMLASLGSTENFSLPTKSSALKDYLEIYNGN